MIIIPASLKVALEDANNQVSGFIENTKKQMGKANEVVDVFGDLAGKAQGFNTVLSAGVKVIDRFPGALGETGQWLQRNNEYLQEGVSQAAELGSAGAQVGALFGPVGSIVGGIAGGLAGAALAAWDWYDATKEIKGTKIDIQKIIQDTNVAMQKGVDLAWEWVRARQAEADAFKAAQDALAREPAKEIEKTVAALRKEQDVLKGNLQALVDTQNATGLTAEQHAELSKITVDLTKVQDELQSRLNAATPALREQAKAADEVTESVTVTIGSMEHLLHVLDAEGPLKGPGDDFLGLLAKDIADANKKLRELEEDAGNLPPPIVGGKESTEKLDKAAAEYQSYLNIVSSGLSVFTAQLEENIATGEAALSGMGIAAERAVSQILKALGREWATKAISELAAGFAALSTPGFSFLAAGHFKSAGLYGAAAAAAGVGGAVAAGDAGRRGNAQAEGGGGASSGGGFGAGVSAADAGPQQLAPIVVNFDSTVPATEREAQQVADRLWSLMGRRERRR